MSFAKEAGLIATFLDEGLQDDPHSWVKAVENQVQQVRDQMDQNEKDDPNLVLEANVTSTTTLLVSQGTLNKDHATKSLLGTVQIIILMGYELGKHEEVSSCAERIHSTLNQYGVIRPYV